MEMVMDKRPDACPTCRGTGLMLAAGSAGQLLQSTLRRAGVVRSEQRRLQQTCDARRVLGRGFGQRALCRPCQKQPGRPQLPHRLSGGVFVPIFGF